MSSSLFAASGASGKILGLGAGGAVCGAVYKRSGKRTVKERSNENRATGSKEDNDEDDDERDTIVVDGGDTEDTAEDDAIASDGGRGESDDDDEGKTSRKAFIYSSSNINNRGGGGGGGKVQYVDLLAGASDAQLSSSPLWRARQRQRRGGKKSARARSASASASASTTTTTTTTTMRESPRTTKTTKGFGDSLALWLRLAAPLLLALAHRLVARRRRARAGARPAGDGVDEDGTGVVVDRVSEDDGTKYPELEAIREMGRAIRAEVGGEWACPAGRSPLR